MKLLTFHSHTNRQMSESFLTAGLLSISGGLQDVYTYISRGNLQRLHWRQIILIIELLLLFIVGFIPENLNLIANALVSFSCAMQVQSFRKVDSYAFASTMCIGNIRSGMEALCSYHQTHNIQTLYKSFHYFGIIFLFALGAGLGSTLILYLGMHTIWISCLLLFLSFSIMFIQES